MVVDWQTIINSLIGPFVVGIVIWRLGERSIDKRLKNDAIRDLMTFRGDYASSDFRRSLNKVSITFHSDDEIRQDVRHLYDVINDPNSPQEGTKRAIVGLIYKLCHKYGYRGLTEYDIDQAFPESVQEPQEPIVQIKQDDRQSPMGVKEIQIYGRRKSKIK